MSRGFLSLRLGHFGLPLGVALLALGLFGSAAAQSPPPPAGGSNQPVLPGDSAPAALEDIDQILQGEEDVLSGGGEYSYDPGNRRDPFKSLLAAPDRREFRGPRPKFPGVWADPRVGIHGPGGKPPFGFAIERGEIEREQVGLLDRFDPRRETLRPIEQDPTSEDARVQTTHRFRARGEGKARGFDSQRAGERRAEF